MTEHLATEAILITITRAKKPMLVGVAHDSQKLKAFKVEEWDIACDYIVTDKATYSATRNRNLNLSQRLSQH
jgi:5-formyltetrahydrofolate cyclo-ligase